MLLSQHQSRGGGAIYRCTGTAEQVVVHSRSSNLCDSEALKIGSRKALCIASEALEVPSAVVDRCGMWIQPICRIGRAKVC
jgi:hypothetical protein